MVSHPGIATGYWLFCICELSGLQTVEAPKFPAGQGLQLVTLLAFKWCMMLQMLFCVVGIPQVFPPFSSLLALERPSRSALEGEGMQMGRGAKSCFVGHLPETF